MCSSDLDLLTYEMLKDAPPAFKDRLLLAVNEILQNSEARLNWKMRGRHARMHYKKGCPEDVANYRPVVLLNVAYKVITAIITNRLTTIAERYNLLDDLQEGFRWEKNTQRQAQALFWEQSKAKDKKKGIT